MKKIAMSSELMFQNLHSLSTDFSFLYDKLVGEFTLSGDSTEFLSLPPDGFGYLRHKDDINLDIHAIFQGMPTFLLYLFKTQKQALLYHSK